MDEAWDALADAVRHRRVQLGLRQSDLEARGGPSQGTVKNIEQAARAKYASRTFAQLETALDWRRGAVEDVLAGKVTGDLRANPDEGQTSLAPGLHVPAAAFGNVGPDVEGAMAEAYRPFGPLPIRNLLRHAEQLLGTFANAEDDSDEMEAVRENHRRTVDLLRAIQRGSAS